MLSFSLLLSFNLLVSFLSAPYVGNHRVNHYFVGHSSKQLRGSHVKPCSKVFYPWYSNPIWTPSLWNFPCKISWSIRYVFVSTYMVKFTACTICLSLFYCLENVIFAIRSNQETLSVLRSATSRTSQLKSVILQHIEGTDSA